MRRLTDGGWLGSLEARLWPADAFDRNGPRGCLAFDVRGQNGVSGLPERGPLVDGESGVDEHAPNGQQAWKR